MYCSHYAEAVILIPSIFLVCSANSMLIHVPSSLQHYHNYFHLWPSIAITWHDIWVMNIAKEESVQGLLCMHVILCAFGSISVVVFCTILCFCILKPKQSNLQHSSLYSFFLIHLALYSTNLEVFIITYIVYCCFMILSPGVCDKVHVCVY